MITFGTWKWWHRWFGMWVYWSGGEKKGWSPWAQLISFIFGRQTSQNTKQAQTLDNLVKHDNIKYHSLLQSQKFPLRPYSSKTKGPMKHSIWSWGMTTCCKTHQPSRQNHIYLAYISLFIQHSLSLFPFSVQTWSRNHGNQRYQHKNKNKKCL